MNKQRSQSRLLSLHHAAVLSIVSWLLPTTAVIAGNIVRVPLDVPTIADALIAAGPSGVVQVAEGTHAGGFTITQGVTLQGGFPVDFVGAADPQAHPTLITGTAGVNAVNVVVGTGQSVFVSGVICTGGAAGVDGSLTGDALLSLDTVTCQANERGMRVDVHDTAIVTGNLVFLVNNTTVGAGGGLSALADGLAGVTLSGGQVAGNSATEGGAGAAVNASVEAVVSFSNTTFADNGYLGGVAVVGPGTILYTVADAGALLVDGSILRGNVPASPGDAAVGGTQNGSSLVQVTNTTFSGSVPGPEGVTGAGGEAVDAQAAGIAALRLVGNVFEGNGGLAGPIVNVLLDAQAAGFILRNRFVGNVSAAPLATSDQLGATFLNFDGNIVRGNTTPQEAVRLNTSVLATGALLRVINNQVSENVATTGGGGGRFMIGGPNVGQIGYNTFVNNTAASGVAGIHLLAPDFGPAQASNNVAVGNVAGGVPADLSVEGFIANSIGNFVTGDGDPGFNNPAQGDFTLAETSVLIDAAAANAFQIDADFEEDPRPVGAAADIGADEFLRDGDFDLDGDVDVVDFDQFVLCFTGADAGPIDAACAPGDADGDDDIDCDDWAAFVAAWTSPGSPPEFAPCAGQSVPTAGAWGLLAMALLLTTAGTVLFGRWSAAIASL